MRTRKDKSITPDDIHGALISTEPTTLIQYIFADPERVRKIIAFHSLRFFLASFTIGSNRLAEVLLENGLRLDATDGKSIAILEGIKRVIARQDIFLLKLLVKFAPSLFKKSGKSSQANSIQNQVLTLLRPHTYLAGQVEALLSNLFLIQRKKKKKATSTTKGEKVKYEIIKYDITKDTGYQSLIRYLDKIMKQSLSSNCRDIEKQLTPYLHCARTDKFVMRVRELYHRISSHKREALQRGIVPVSKRTVPPLLTDVFIANFSYENLFARLKKARNYIEEPDLTNPGWCFFATRRLDSVTLKGPSDFYTFRYTQQLKARQRFIIDIDGRPLNLQLHGSLENVKDTDTGISTNISRAWNTLVRLLMLSRIKEIRAEVIVPFPRTERAKEYVGREIAIYHSLDRNFSTPDLADLHHFLRFLELSYEKERITSRNAPTRASLQDDGGGAYMK